MMTPERWQHLKPLFHSALEHQPHERAAFLNHACAGDAHLRAELESLIAAHEQTGEFLDAPAYAVAATLLADDLTGLAVGQSLGHYKIVDLLGAGGMGEVYLARDTKLERAVALKILPAAVAADRQRMQRFMREAQAVSALNHPNILTIHEISSEHGTPFIATEFIDGETLRASLSRSRLSLPAAPTRALVQTDAGVVMGTVHYMSPEQARALAVDERTDIWSLGVVLYEMVAGRLPFAGETASDVIAAILKTEPPILTRHAPEVPAELERIVTKALRKDREERYQSSKELGLDLKSLKQHLEFEAELERTGTPERSEAARRMTTDEQPGEIETTPVTAAQTGGASHDIHTTSSAEYIVSEIKHHKRGALVALTILVAVTVALAYFASARYFAGSSTGTIDSVAVLPFTNASGDAEMEYLSDGISESLINSLSQLPGVKVIARSSSFKYKGKEVDPQEVARSLGVQAVVMGRVGQRGEQLQVSAELVDAREGTQAWGEQYNRKAEDLLAVQAEISREIAEKLRLRLTAGEQQRLTKRGTVNPQAYELLLKGRFYRNKGGTENQKKAIEYFNQAIAVDPTYALAYAELSSRYQALVNNSVLDPKEFTPKAEAAARRALELDERLAEAHDALALLKLNAWDWAAAEREFKRAIELNPNLARAYNQYAFYLSLVGRHEQAIAEQKLSRELDPLSPGINANVGNRFLFARQYDQAIEALKKTLELDQSISITHIYLGYAYAAKGLYAEAIAAYQEAIKLDDNSPSTQIYLGAAYAMAGEREKAQAILKRLHKEYVSPGELAVLYAALGEREQAFASLEKAYTAHDLQLQYLGVDPAFDPLRSDPRFQELLRRVGLPQ